MSTGSDFSIPPHDTQVNDCKYKLAKRAVHNAGLSSRSLLSLNSITKYCLLIVFFFSSSSLGQVCTDSRWVTLTVSQTLPDPPSTNSCVVRNIWIATSLTYSTVGPGTTYRSNCYTSLDPYIVTCTDSLGVTRGYATPTDVLGYCSTYVCSGAGVTTTAPVIPPTTPATTPVITSATTPTTPLSRSSTTSNTDTDSSSTVAPTTTVVSGGSSNNNVPAIVGGAVGGFAALLLAVVGIFWLIKRNPPPPPQPTPSIITADPYAGISPMMSPMMSPMTAPSPQPMMAPAPQMMPMPMYAQDKTQINPYDQYGGTSR